MTCEKSFLRDQAKHWQIAYVSNLSEKDKNARMESIETAVYNHGYADSTCKKWMTDLLKWKDSRQLISKGA